MSMNDNIPTVYWWLTAAGLPLWVSAIWWNVQAARRGVLEYVKIRAATAVLAVIYLVGNCVLLFTDVDPGGWSDVMRGFMVLSIPIVWELPARLSVRVADKIRATDMRLKNRAE